MILMVSGTTHLKNTATYPDIRSINLCSAINVSFKPSVRLSFTSAQ